MNKSPSEPAKASGRMIICAFVIASCMGLYYLFIAVNSLARADQTVTAKVISEGYRESGRSYYTQAIDNRPLVMPQTIVEMFLLNLDFGGRETECAVVKGSL